MRRAGYQSVWSPACQDQVTGGQAGGGVISLGGVPLSLPSFVTPEFQEFFKLGRVLRTTLPTDMLLQAVFTEAQVVCIGQPMLIAGDLISDPAVIPCLAKGISAGKFVDLALAYSFGAGVTPDATCKFNLEWMVLDRVGILLLAVPMRWLRPMPALSLIGGPLLTFQWLLAFALISMGGLILLARRCVSRSGLLVGLTLRIRPPRRLRVLSRMSVDAGVVPPKVFC